MDPFLTIYNGDYTKKVKCMENPSVVPMEFQDPLNESYKLYLQLSSTPTPPEHPSEDFDKYLEKLKEKKPKVASLHFKSPIDNPIMQRLFLERARSNYQYDYCDLDKDEEYKELERQKNMFRLPEDAPMPLTSQLNDYRNPATVNSRAYNRKPIRSVPNNLDPEAHIRDILKVTTGETVYTNTIGALGEIIINEHLHGELKHPRDCDVL